jgi:DNA adenine methylase
MPAVRRRTERRIAFGWYGGKFSHLDWLLPLLPRARHYCEPFGGSAAVLINREPSPIETYNDLDGEVVNFFRVLREQRDELSEAIGLTPFSKREFELAIGEPRTGLAQTASVGRWAHCTLTSRAGMAGAVSRWLGAIEDLPEIAQRLLRVQFENAPADEVIRRYDSPDTLFYCDPPYPHDSRGDRKAYGYEMTDEEHGQLAKLLKKCRGKVAVSSYHSPVNDENFRGWRCVEAPEKLCHSVKKLRREVLFVNYEPGS